MSNESEPLTSLPTTRDVAVLLAEIATLLELSGGDAFRSRAYRRAARALEGIEADLGALAREDRLTTLPGVGAGIGAVIREYVLTGSSAVRDSLRESVPAGMQELMRVPALGPKRAYTLCAEHGIDSLDALEDVARSGRLAKIPGFGVVIQRRVLEAIPFARRSLNARLYPDALEVALRIVTWLRERPEVATAEIAGAIRRRSEIAEQIDLVAATDRAEALLAAFRDAFEPAAPPGDAPSEMTIHLMDGMPVHLRCVAPKDFAAAMVWETGSVAHLGKLARVAEDSGLTLGREGLVEADTGEPLRFGSEAELHARLGLAYVPPELREGLDELELAASNRIPELVDVSVLRGVFHCHTTASDGRASLEEMANAARERGWSYLGIADHSRTAVYARGLSTEQLLEQVESIAQLNERALATGDPFHIFSGVESDILPDGMLDYPDEVLRRLDYVVGSVHSAFRMPREEMTARIVRAMESEWLTMLGHPTGRLLLRREGYDVDIDTLLETAARTRTVLEINADPRRLDLDWRHVRQAVRMGIAIAINPDAHSTAALDNVRYGVDVARKAGVEPRMILNTWPLEHVTEFLRKRKQDRQT